MNTILITGRLTATPELRTTPNGKNVTDFTLAVKRKLDKDKTDFIRCTAWGKLADTICTFKTQGDLIGVYGTMRTEKYKDKDGNEREKVYVLVSEVEFFNRVKETPTPVPDFNAPARDQRNGQIPDDNEDFPF